MTDVADNAAPEGDSLSADDLKYFESRGASLDNDGGEIAADAGSAEPQGDGGAKAEQPRGKDGKFAAAEKAEGEPAEGEGDEPAADGKPRTVPHGAFHEERTKRKALEQEFNKKQVEWAAEKARIDERLNLLMQAVQTPAAQQQDAAPPSIEEDPLGYIKWQAEQTEKRFKELEERGNKTAQLTEQQVAEHQLQQAYLADAQAFMQQNPDLANAYQFLLQGRDDEYAAMGVTDPAERRRMVVAEERSLVQSAIKAGVSPTARLYQLAMARGYRKAEPQADAAKQDQAEKQFAAADKGVAEVAALLKGEADKIDNINKGQSAAKSLSAASGSSGNSLSAEALANMSEEEFMAMTAKLSKHQMRALMGG